MTKPKITITISGPTGSGKSTLAEYLAGDLAIANGLEVVLQDDGQRQQLPTSHRSVLPQHFNPAVIITVEQK